MLTFNDTGVLYQVHGRTAVTTHDLLFIEIPAGNWYFQEIDRQLGTSALRSYIKEIGYGNEIINSDLSSYWMQSALKISPVEQVDLLTNLYNNDFGFTPENVNAVKDSICLFSSENESFYGKTGTGRVNDKDINGWFIGFCHQYPVHGKCHRQQRIRNLLLRFIRYYGNNKNLIYNYPLKRIILPF